MSGPRQVLIKVQDLKIGELLDLGGGEPYVRQNLQTWRDPIEAGKVLQRLETAYTEVLDVVQDSAASIKIRFRKGDNGELRFPIDHEVLAVRDD